MPVTFGTSLPSRGEMAGPEQLRAIAQRAEDLGYDHVWVSDHIILPKRSTLFTHTPPTALLRSGLTSPTSNR